VRGRKDASEALGRRRRRLVEVRVGVFVEVKACAWLPVHGLGVRAKAYHA
jgi:hypothetical protein